MRGVWSAFAAGAIVLAATSHARADDAASLAQERYAEGTAALDRNDFEGARLALLQAYAVDPEPRYLFSLALAEARGPHPVEALAHFRQFLRTPAVTDDQRRAAAVWSADAQAKTGHVRILAPDGARLTLDETTDLGTAPMAEPVDVTPGHHRIDARRGTQLAAADIDTAPGQSVLARISLPEPSASAPIAVAPAGREGGAGASTVPVTDNGKPVPGPRWITSAGLVVTGLVSFAVAGGVDAAAGDENNKWARLDAQTGACSQPPMTAGCAALKRAADARSTDQNVATGFIVGGSVLVAGGLLTLVFWPASRRAIAGGTLAPLLAPNVQGASWLGTF